jgi:hypothetical protein
MHPPPILLPKSFAINFSRLVRLVRTNTASQRPSSDHAIFPLGLAQPWLLALDWVNVQLT